MKTLHASADISPHYGAAITGIIKQRVRDDVSRLLMNEIRGGQRYIIRLTESIHQTPCVYDADLQEYHCSIELEEIDQ